MKIRRFLYYLVFWVCFFYSAYLIIFQFAPDFTPAMKIAKAGVIAGALALFFASLKINDIMNSDKGNEKMQQLSNIIFKGSMTFLKREYLIMFFFIAVIFGLIFKFISKNTAYCFITGAFVSALAGLIGMFTATKANARTAQAAHKSLNSAFKIAFSGGLVMGLSVVGLAMIALPVLYLNFKDPAILSGFAFGASTVALFARVGGGIYTKAADVGADLVGKVEQDIPEDDPRNPAVIADNVGDNVGDVAGMGADLFESYVGSIIACMTLGVINLDILGAFIPLTVAAMGIFASIIGSAFVRTNEKGNPMVSLQTGIVVSILALLGSSYYLIKYIFLPDVKGIFPALAIGVFAGALLGFLTQYYTSASFKPVKSIVKAAETGAATTVISGVKVGMISTFAPLVLISLASISAFIIAGGMGSYNVGAYGVSLAAVGMLATVGMVVAVDAYGPIADNAGGIAQMAGLDPIVRQRTDKLDAVGNTTAAIGKGFAIGSAALTALTLLVAFALTIDLEQIDLLNPFVNCSLVFGASLPFLFCGLTMGAVGKAAEKMVNEVRRQFKAEPKILEGTVEPDYKSCIKISAKSAIFSMILPGLIAVAIPVGVGLTVAKFFGHENGAQAIGGLLMGAIASGVCLAIMMANSGGAWDNAKKAIEENGGNKNIHDCAVIGDTVGDPFKDTAGPSLNILIKLMSIVALVCAGFFMK